VLHSVTVLYCAVIGLLQLVICSIVKRKKCLHSDGPEIASLVLLSLLFDVFNIYYNRYFLC